MGNDEAKRVAGFYLAFLNPLAMRSRQLQMPSKYAPDGLDRFRGSLSGPYSLDNVSSVSAMD